MATSQALHGWLDAEFDPDNLLLRLLRFLRDAQFVVAGVEGGEGAVTLDGTRAQTQHGRSGYPASHALTDETNVSACSVASTACNSETSTMSP